MAVGPREATEGELGMFERNLEAVYIVDQWLISR